MLAQFAFHKIWTFVEKFRKIKVNEKARPYRHDSALSTVGEQHSYFRTASSLSWHPYRQITSSCTHHFAKHIKMWSSRLMTNFTYSSNNCNAKFLFRRVSVGCRFIWNNPSWPLSPAFSSAYFYPATSYSAFANSCPLQTDTFLFPLIHSHTVVLSSNKF